MHTFFYSTFTCSTASHIALEEAGLPYEGIEVSWKRGLNVKALEAVNPAGQVPTLLVDGDQSKVLTQSVAILEYIADHGQKKLLPAPGTWERAQAMRWLAFVAADYHKSFGPVFRASAWTTNETAQNEIKAAARAHIEKHLGVLDAHLKGRDFLLGKSFSVVDMYAFIATGWCKAAEVKIAKFPNVRDFMHRVYEIPSVQKVLQAEDMMGYIPE